MPAGTVWLGTDRPLSDEDGPAHRATLSRDVWLATFEASAGCYAWCLEEGACLPPIEPANYGEGMPAGYAPGYYRDPARADDPMLQLPRDAARAYCRWLGGRLPTNAEWESAARGTDGRAQPWGPAPADPRLPEIADIAEFCAHAHHPALSGYGVCDGPVTIARPLGSFPNGAGPYGHLDLLGNVQEWVEDDYVPYGSGDRLDPLDRSSGAPGVVRSITTTWYRLAADPERPSIMDRDPDFYSPRRPVGARCAFDSEPIPLRLRIDRAPP